MRYNTELTGAGLTSIGCGGIRAEAVQKMDSVAAVDPLRRTSEEVGNRKVLPRALRRLFIAGGRMSDANQASGGAVVGLAGRRIDAPGADPPRFPPERVPAVRQRLVDMLAAERAAVLVCSAACGADLVALEAAERLGLRRRIVLPFAAERFRTTSVTDRPVDWGPLFDRMIAAAGAAGDLVVLDSGEGDDAACRGERGHHPRGAGACPGRCWRSLISAARGDRLGRDGARGQ